MILHLGIVDQPYRNAPSPARKGKRWRRSDLIGGASATTGDVAGYLEDRYHPFEIFYELHKAEIAADLETGLAGALESILMGAPVDLSVFGSAESKIDDHFRKFLDAGELESLGYPGMPTEASGRGKRIGGINHRLRHPYAKSNPARPSLIDTGLYQSSFKSWVD